MMPLHVHVQVCKYKHACAYYDMYLCPFCGSTQNSHVFMIFFISTFSLSPSRI